MTMSILLTLAASGLAGGLAAKFKLPGGAILWALGAAAILHITVADLPPMPPALRVVAQILIGIALGTTVTRSPLRALYAVRWPLVLCMALLLALSVGAGLLLAKLTPLDPATAVFAVAPGGASDMAAASLYFGLDPALIAGFQVIRQLLVLVVVPMVFGLIPPSPPAERA